MPVLSTFAAATPSARVTAVGTPDGDVLAAPTVTMLIQPPMIRASCVRFRRLGSPPAG